MISDQWFRVTCSPPSGFRFAVTGRASSDADAVRIADETVEYVSRTGISDHVNTDGITGRPTRLAEGRAPSGR